MKHTKWQMGSSSGIKTEKSFPIYVFFQKYKFSGTDWVKDAVEYKTVTITTAAITDSEMEEYKKENGITGDVYGDTDGDESSVGDNSITPTVTPSEKGNGSTQKSAVKTGDDSPIGVMVSLAAVAMLAGGYVVVRKRKKEE